MEKDGRMRNAQGAWLRCGLTLAVAAGILTQSVGASAQGKKTAAFDVTTVQSGTGVQVTVNSKVWITPTQARAEVKDPLNGEVIFLVTNGYFYQLDPKGKRGIKGPLPAQLSKSKDNFDVLMGQFSFDASNALKVAEKTRTDTISGYKCDVYEKTATQGDASRSLSIWMPQTLSPKFPIKVVKKDKVNKPGASVEQSVDITLSNIKVNTAIPASVFAVPSGYKITTGKPKSPKAGK
jgi:outer membrane lipoprotein-sorting protein